ncbi:MAG: Mrp/NBP35 family ATP-binding protein [Finegoldia sp.]|nr:Mrp/NBP35 family ATP-binding protein [Finegoldia sp.]
MERKLPNFLVESNTGSEIGKIIGIVSGKGGVGKSLITCLLANAIAKKGYKVGIMDADITGPSIPKYYGIKEKATGDQEGHLNPVLTANGIRVMSMNLMLGKDDESVIWRGPVIAGVVKQFYQDTNWGELDYLFVDMPPGTGDVPLTVFQSLPINGIVVAMSPSALVEMIVKKAIDMARKMGKNILALVENMSYLECPECGTHIEVFGSSTVDELAAKENIDTIVKIPINPEISKKTEEGKIADLDVYFLDDLAKKIEDL